MEKLDQTKQKQKKSQKTVGLLKKKVICVIAVPEGEDKMHEVEKYLKKSWHKTSPIWQEVSMVTHSSIFA